MFHYADRPGPKSGGSRTCLPQLHDDTAFQAGQVGSVARADVRVGGSCGRNPPEAQPKRILSFTSTAKPHDPDPIVIYLNRYGALGPTIVNAVIFACFFSQFCTCWQRQTLQKFRLGAALIPSLAHPTRLPLEYQVFCLLTQLFGGVLVQLGLLTYSKLSSRTLKYLPTRVFSGCVRRRRSVMHPSRVNSCWCPARQQPFTQGGCHQPKQVTPLRPTCGPLRRFWVLLGFLWVQPVQAAFSAPTIHPSPNPTAAQPLKQLRAHGNLATQLTASRKRSFKRAQAKALKEGTVRYRGRTHTVSSLALQRVTSQVPSRLAPRPQNPNDLRFVTWNCGGLHAAKYEEVLAWLEQERASCRPVHILCVQETKWAQDSEFSNEGWHVVHSGSGRANEGIAFFVSREIATTAQLQHAALIPGRMAHLRIRGSPIIDLLGVYQHAWAHPVHFGEADASCVAPFQSKGLAGHGILDTFSAAQS